MKKVNWNGCIVAESEAADKLSELRAQRRLLGLDYDGTICGAGVTHTEAAELVHQMMLSGITPAIITARGITLETEFLPALRGFLRQRGSNQRCFLGTANGLTLREITSYGSKELHLLGSLALEEVVYVAERYKELSLPPIPGAVAALISGLEEWKGFLAEERIRVILEYGTIWVEDSLILLPIPEKGGDDIVAAMRETLPDELQIAVAGRGVVVVTRSLEEDPKRFSLLAVQEELGVSDEEIGSFGDRPQGNDRFLLQIPYGFTNSPGYIPSTGSPPFLLSPPCDGSQVRQVHRAIEYLMQ